MSLCFIVLYFARKSPVTQMERYSLICKRKPQKPFHKLHHQYHHHHSSNSFICNKLSSQNHAKLFHNEIISRCNVCFVACWSSVWSRTARMNQQWSIDVQCCTALLFAWHPSSIVCIFWHSSWNEICETNTPCTIKGVVQRQVALHQLTSRNETLEHALFLTTHPSLFMWCTIKKDACVFTMMKKQQQWLCHGFWASACPASCKQIWVPVCRKNIDQTNQFWMRPQLSIFCTSCDSTDSIGMATDAQLKIKELVVHKRLMHVMNRHELTQLLNGTHMETFWRWHCWSTQVALAMFEFVIPRHKFLL